MASDGQWLLNLPWIGRMLESVGADADGLMLDAGFIPARASEVFGAGG